MPKRVRVRFKSHARAVKRHVGDVLQKRLDKAADHAVEELKITLSKPGPSAPGQPPGEQTGKLVNSIRWKAPSKWVRRIGTPLRYGFTLEMGESGGKIYPKTKKALAIPVSALRGAVSSLGRGGVTKKHQQEVIFRAWRNPIKARPWIKPTFFKITRRLGQIVGHRIS